MNAEIARNNTNTFTRVNDLFIIDEYLKVSLIEIEKVSKEGFCSKSFMLNSVTESFHNQIQERLEQLGFQTKYNSREPEDNREYLDYGAMASVTVSW